MHKNISLSALLTGTLLFTASVYAQPPAPLATVNGEPLTQAQFDLYQQQRRMERRNPGAPPEAVLAEMIDVKLLEMDALKQGMDKQADIAARLSWIRTSVLASARLRALLTEEPIGEEQILAAYDARYSGGGISEYTARHILVEEEQKAKELIKELDGGADFAELAKTHSTGPSGPQGGKLDWFTSEQMVAPFSEAVSKLEKGKHTAAPVKTRFGWHVILLEDTRSVDAPPLDQLRPQLQRELMEERRSAYMEQLRKAAKIEYPEKAEE